MRSRILSAALAILAATASIGRADMLYVTENDGTVVRYDTSSSAQPTTFNIGVGQPRGVAVDASGNLLVTVLSRGVYKVGPDGSTSLFASVPRAYQGLAIDAAGNVFVPTLPQVQSDTDPFIPSRIERITPGGVVSDFATNQFLPYGLATDKAGNLYSTNTANQILKYTPGGVSSLFATLSGMATGLAFDAAGNLYAAVGASGGNLIARITPGGVSSTFATGMSTPIGLAFDSAGNLFVANSASRTINEIAPEGTVRLFATTGALPTFLAIAPSPVPEPSSLALGGTAALVGWGIARARRRPA